MISIKGMDKAEVAARLYNASRAQGMGLMNYVPQDTTVEQMRMAISVRTEYYLKSRCPPEEALRRALYFDYVEGRVMKVDLSGDEFDESLYDRDLGAGAAARALERGCG